MRPSGLPHGLALAAALAFALAAWLLLPIHASGEARRPVLRAVLLDASPSATRRRPAWESWARSALDSEARAAEQAGEALLEVAFASDVRSSSERGRSLDLAAERLAGERDPASELDRALELVEGAAGGRRLRVRLYGDGSFTGPDPAPRLRRLAARGARFERVELAPAELGDVGVARVRLPERVEPGTPLAAQVDLLAAADDSAEALEVALELELEDRSGIRTWRVPARLPAERGDRPWPVRVELGAALPGATRVTARVLSADPIPENDRATAWVRASGELVVALVSSDGARERSLAWLGGADAAARRGMGLLAFAPGEIALALERADVLVTVDVAPSILPAQALRSFLERGGGWLACAGFGALEGWSGVAAGTAAELLPLVPAGDDRPRDVILLADGSGSMAGEAFDEVRAAALELARAARPRDEVSLRLFTDRLEGRIVLRSREPTAEDRAEAARALLAARAPGGPTDVARVLRELAAERQLERREALVLLLSDGRDQEARAGGPGHRAELRGRLRAARVLLVAFAAGPEADEAFLQSLLERGENVRRAAEPGELGSLFAREALAGTLLEGEGFFARAVPPEKSESDLAGELRRALVAAGGSELAQLERAVRAELRPGAEPLAVARGGEPLLAVQPVGLGAGAAWASAPLDGGAPAWPSAHFAALLRALGRGRADQAAPVTLAIEGGDLVLANAPPDWPALLIADCASLTPSGSWGRELQREPLGAASLAAAAGPAGDPREGRRGRAPGELLRLPAGAVCEVALAERSGAPLATLPLAAPGPGEFAWPPRTLEGIPAAGPAPLAETGRHHPAAAPALACAMALLFASALALRLRRRRLAASAAPGPRAGAGSGELQAAGAERR
jgi:hypothetical protein